MPCVNSGETCGIELLAAVTQGAHWIAPARGSILCVPSKRPFLTLAPPKLHPLQTTNLVAPGDPRLAHRARVLLLPRRSGRTPDRKKPFSLERSHAGRGRRCRRGARVRMRPVLDLPGRELLLHRSRAETGEGRRARDASAQLRLLTGGLAMRWRHARRCGDRNRKSAPSHRGRISTARARESSGEE